MAEDDKPADTAKKGGAVFKKYKWWFIGAGGVFLGIIFVAVKKANSATGSTTSAADTTAAQNGINPATGYLYGSPADVAAQGGGGTSTGGVPGPAGPAGPPGQPGVQGFTGPSGAPPIANQAPGMSNNGYPPANSSAPIMVTPHSAMYTTKPGDTLGSIAQSTGVSHTSLYAMNKNVIGGTPGAITPGMRLRTA
jgi:LysM repeat protein